MYTFLKNASTGNLIVLLISYKSAMDTYYKKYSGLVIQLSQNGFSDPYVTSHASHRVILKSLLLYQYRESGHVYMVKSVPFELPDKGTFSKYLYLAFLTAFL